MDELSIFTGNANRHLAVAICRELRIPLGDADVFQFSNENIFVKINESVRDNDVYIVQPLSTPVNRSIMEMHYLVGRPDGVEHFTERHELTLFQDEEMLDAFRAAGLAVEHDHEGGPMGRGLYIGLAPAG